ncbi:SMP-30/gluconolactonase/LRE family protein [Commensalibacter papalotli (ex Botero et al. 2024)]|uniref:Sugar lactone lactonase YvrE (YvrE) (PDB:1E1A) n=1 Tax=Commensalibacter papalotli (ex Botero et al. 2024) TaxID=2972766 RepID=A0ABM9HN98_9PROT|nr:SMP-30/gluconolactonase/LRE family protein [Commensalibacter papalotli (ex Botero et al. 2024)]CAI3936185.1 Sugar lactone lactonase YvrE (YvrE) (PDB:1E1A) [Commensalibacter papalotli (ex Botero et al. 2024)]CAI3939496.1 Sugar lactone lactonase YvrE (YvrE) (PDB:1E1A) [Commensalibacter papalotli (ex Botero et al. 2024)]
MIHTKFFEPVCLWDAKTLLGEGVVWVEREQSVYFVNILEKKIYKYHLQTQTKTIWNAPKQPTFIFPTTGHLLLCGMEDGLYWFDPAQGKFTQWFVMQESQEGNRLNDGYIDSLGRLWFGTMDKQEQHPFGSLYLLDFQKDGKICAVPQDSHYTVTNGPLIIEEQHKLYHNHSNEQIVYRFDWQDSGKITNKEKFLKMDKGYPDGMAVDMANHLWICLFGGHQISVYSVDAELVQTIPIPSLNITKIAFGGDDYKTAYVTTATKGMTEADKQLYPLAGGLFSFKVSTPGKPQNLFQIPEMSILK